TDDEKLELSKLLEKEDVLTTEIVHKIIKDNFGVDYTFKQVRIIVKSFRGSEFFSSLIIVVWPFLSSIPVI
ncbi:MAG: hypothetical protein IJI84_01695, partial [Clostridia bacterium]|nr:hypothetical protein [Clostridia bacterium]